MKARRKLIPAIVLLLVSVLMLSTASYAWFANRTTVTVSGLSISAQAPTSVKIRRADQEKYSTTNFDCVVDIVETGKVSKNLAPVTIDAIDNASGDITWKTAIGNVPDSKDALVAPHVINDLTDKAFGYKDEANTEEEKAYGAAYGVSASAPNGDAVETAYFVKLTFNVYAEVDDVTLEPQTLLLNSVTLTDNTKVGNDPQLFADLYKSVRVLVVAKNSEEGDKILKSVCVGDAGNEFTYPEASDQNKNVATYSPNDNDKIELFKKVAVNDKNSTTIDYDTIEVYVFFEGEADECKAENLKDALDNLSISFEFGIKLFED